MGGEGEGGLGGEGKGGLGGEGEGEWGGEGEDASTWVTLAAADAATLVTCTSGGSGENKDDGGREMVRCGFAREIERQSEVWRWASRGD